MRARVLVALPAVFVFALANAFAPPWPDDWDGVGFVDAIGHFDMDRFSPHAPGYPVYVALAKVVAFASRTPLGAATWVSILSGALACFFFGDAARRVISLRAGFAVASFVALSPLAFHSMSGVGTESCALAFASLAAWLLARRGKQCVEYMCIACGIGLGVRLSWAPLYLALVAIGVTWRARERPSAVVRSVAAFAIGVCAWAIPLAVVVGPSHLASLARTQAVGHATRWGGTALTDGGAWSRVSFLARDVFVDGLGVSFDALGVAIAIGALAVAALGAIEWRRAGYRGWRTALVAIAPYSAWILVGQNVREAPRHALPLVVACALALGVSAVTSRNARALGVALVLLIGARALLDAYARRTIPPAGAQLVALATKIRDDEHERVAVFGQASTRFFEGSGIDAPIAGTLGDAQLALEGTVGADRALVTDEVQDLTLTHARVTEIATLCRPPRLDRRRPCLRVYDARFPFLPSVRQKRELVLPLSL